MIEGKLGSMSIRSDSFISINFFPGTKKVRGNPLGFAYKLGKPSTRTSSGERQLFSRQKTNLTFKRFEFSGFIENVGRLELNWPLVYSLYDDKGVAVHVSMVENPWTAPPLLGITLLVSTLKLLAFSFFKKSMAGELS